jgi:hypothetical protein
MATLFIHAKTSPTNGRLTILPPSYKKHVGRPRKYRIKALGEVDCRGGGKRMSRHGVIIHCSHCDGPDHKKMDVLGSKMDCQHLINHRGIILLLHNMC